MKTAGAWTTEHEIAFLSKLGLNRYKATNKLTRKTLLKMYGTAMANRTNWDGLDQEAIKKALRTFVKEA